VDLWRASASALDVQRGTNKNMSSENPRISADGGNMNRSKRMLCLEGRNVLVRPGLCRMAEVEGEGYKFLADPKAAIAALKDSGTADVFTFLPELTETSPQHPYAFESDNFAVLPISTFEEWWSKQIGFKARNKAKQAEKKGIVIREVRLERKSGGKSGEFTRK